MPVECPYCQHPLAIKNAKPGLHTPECPDCQRTFQLAVFDDPEKPPVAAAIPSEREKAGGGAQQAEGRGMVAYESAESAGVAGGAGAEPLRIGFTGRPAGVPIMLGGYYVVAELGRGAMGPVYLAKQVLLNRDVALKVMKPQWASNATFLARFTREAYAVRLLTHHNLVRIYEFGEQKGTTYFSREYVDGQTLAGLMRENARLRQTRPRATFSRRHAGSRSLMTRACSTATSSPRTCC